MILKGPGVQARTLVVPHLTEQVGHGLPGAGGEGAPGGVTRGYHSIEEARLLAQAVVQQAQEQAERLLAQAQVELGRARAEAERLRAEAETLQQQAAARLVEAGVIVNSEADARRLLQESQETAAEIVAGAEAQATTTLLEGHARGLEEGRREGYQAGVQQAREELSAQLTLVHELAARAKVERAEVVAAAEPEIVRLALTVARKVIAREVESDPNILRGLLTRAMLRAAGDDPVRLRLNPRAIETLGDFLTDTTARFRSRGVEVVPDPAVDPAGVIVETRTGVVDARTDTQLGKVERTLMALTGE